jgi:predicted Zn-dependent protease
MGVLEVVEAEAVVQEVEELGRALRGATESAEPSQEFKILHSEATTAFIDHDYNKADDFAQRAILANPEIFAAHSLLSEIHFARGDKDKALAALFNGAHTRPKDIQVWSRVANLILGGLEMIGFQLSMTRSTATIGLLGGRYEHPCAISKSSPQP